jgi:hypothetical protein
MLMATVVLSYRRSGVDRDYINGMPYRQRAGTMASLNIAVRATQRSPAQLRFSYDGEAADAGKTSLARFEFNLGLVEHF